MAYEKGKNVNSGSYKRGREAYKDGKLRKDNPHPLIGHNADQWDKGYADAERESKNDKGQFTSKESI